MIRDYATRRWHIVLGLATLHLVTAVGKVGAWREVVLVTWGTAFLTANAARIVTLLGVMANGAIGVALLGARSRLHRVAIASVAFSAFGVFIHGYVFATGELVSAGCAARALAPAASDLRRLLFGVACVAFVLSGLAALWPADTSGVECPQSDGVEPQGIPE